MSACAQTQPNQSVDTQTSEQTWTPRIQDGDLLEFIKLVQEATGKLFVIDPRVEGRVTIVNSKPLNRQQMFDLLEATLDVQGYTAVEVDNIVRIIPKVDANSEAPVQQ